MIDLVGAMKIRGIHAGPIANSVASEAMTTLLIGINRRYGSKGRYPGDGPAMTRHRQIFAAIPAKPFVIGKVRLGLDKERRIALNRAFLSHVLGTVAEVISPERIIVVSRDRDALDLARSLGAQALVETGICNLNAALARSAHWAGEQGAVQVLTLFSDLPYLEAEDVAEMAKSPATGSLPSRPTRLMRAPMQQ